MKFKTAIAVAAIAVALAGCNRSLGSLTSGEPQRLPSAPVEPVQTGQLPPPSDGLVDNGLQSDPNAQTAAASPGVAPVAPGTEAQTSVDASAPAPTGEPVTREGVSGAWAVNSDNPDCRMILAFTKWSGGYRAATKRCSSPEVASVSAWDVKGEQVVLMDGAGNTVARLYQSGPERYDGTTSNGQPISFVR